ncbi:restriction endonuclease subunit S [Bacillus toyonensis]|uniref:restriction endonuclease subunit S n=1 Tax=Bacillus toyonensis TaxID=155322 RepID=UPI002FFFBBBB
MSKALYQKLSEIAEITMGQSPASSDCNDSGKGLPFYQGNANFGFKHPTPSRYCTKPKKIAVAGDILFSVRAPVGDVNIANEECAIGRGLSAIKSIKASQQYLYFFLQSYKKKWGKVQQGSTFEAVNKNDLAELNVFIPPLQEQKKIASILSSIDKAIEKTEAIIEQTEKVKKGLMQQFLKKGIGHTSFKNTEIGEIPEEWNLGTLKNYSEHITKGATPTTYGFDWVEEGVLFLRNECVKETGLSLKGSSFISEEAHIAMKRSIINLGDILITITGNLGQCCIYDKGPQEANINQHIARIRIIDNTLYPQFVRYFLNSDFMRKKYELIKTGLAYPQLSLKQIQDIVIPIPSIEEQQQIVKILSNFEKKIEVEQISLTRLQNLKKGLMQSFFTGKVRVKVDEDEVTQV